MDLDYILKSVANSMTDEGERIALIKDLLVNLDDCSEADRVKIGSTLAGIIVNRGDDLLVRQHAANEIGHYLQSAPNSIGLVFRNADENVDLRFNIQASFPEEFSVTELPSA